MNLTYDNHQFGTRALVEKAARHDLVPIGSPGGTAWTATTRTLLFASIESGWPIGHLLAWIPTGIRRDPWYLLDGHRRLRTLMELVEDHDDPLVRDLSTPEPAYLPAGDAAAGGPYLPVRAMLDTLPFLAATQSLTPKAAHRGEQVTAPIHRARFDIVTLLGGTPAQVRSVCRRLVPGRVTAEAFAHLT